MDRWKVRWTSGRNNGLTSRQKDRGTIAKLTAYCINQRADGKTYGQIDNQNNGQIYGRTE